MTRFVAKLGLTLAGLAVALGNYWFTFGLWPRSWVSFVGFGILTIVLLLLNVLIDKEKSA